MRRSIAYPPRGSGILFAQPGPNYPSCNVASWRRVTSFWILNVLVFEQLQKLRRRADPGELLGHIGLLRKLGDLAEHRQVLVGDLERGGDDQEEGVHGLAVDRVEIDAVELATERHTQPVHRQCAAVGDRDVVADPRRAERLAPLQHLHERLDRKSTRLNSSHVAISYAVFCLKKKNKKNK